MFKLWHPGPIAGGMKRQNFDTPQRRPQTGEAPTLVVRAARVAQLKALVEAGLYRVDTAALAAALERRRDELPFRLSIRRSLDRELPLHHAS